MTDIFYPQNNNSRNDISDNKKALQKINSNKVNFNLNVKDNKIFPIVIPKIIPNKLFPIVIPKIIPNDEISSLLKENNYVSTTKCPDFISLEMLKSEMKGNTKNSEMKGNTKKSEMKGNTKKSEMKGNSKNSEIDFNDDKNKLWEAYCSVMFCENPFGIVINDSEMDNNIKEKRTIFIQNKK
jgi:hypothetical protein